MGDGFSCTDSDISMGAVRRICSLLYRCIGTRAYDVDLARIARIIREEEGKEIKRLREALEEIASGKFIFIHTAEMRAREGLHNSADSLPTSSPSPDSEKKDE